MANISNVISVSLLESGSTADRDNMNLTAIMTDQQDAVLSSANRYELYTDLASVGTDFGTSSEMYSHAKIFFATSPNPSNSSGALVAGYWRSASETVAASAGILTSAELSEATAVGQLQEIDDGSFVVTVDSAELTITALDFRDSISLANVVAEINANASFTGVTATLSSDNKIIFTSDTTGATSTMTYVSEHTTGTFVGDILALSTGSGASLVQGAIASSLTLETKETAVTELKALINVKGIMFIDAPTSAEAATLASYAQSNDTLIYDVFGSASNLEVDITNVVWANKLAGYTNYRMLYSASNNRKLATSYMSRVHSVNFGAENSALTMQLKELAVVAEAYTQTELTKAKNVGLDVYTTIKNTPVVLTSGANDFVDNRYNLIAFQDAVSTDLYNLLKQTNAKIPQTTRGVNQLVDQCEKTTREFVRAGVFAAGTWTSTDFFGNVDVFNRNIENNGYYFLAGSLADQTQADREARKSPILQGALKMSGAVHSVNIILSVNK